MNNISLLIILLFTFGCANPMGSLKSEIEDFKTNYPNNFETIKLENRNIHYAWSGDKTKRPLVFVHGSPGSWVGWAKYLNNEALQQRFHLLAIDRPGYGGSDKGITERVLTHQAQTVLEVLKTNKSDKSAILIGHSFGGPVVAEAAMISEKPLGGLIFIASSVDPKLEKTKWFQHIATWWPIRILLPKAIRVCNEEIMALKAQLKLQTKQWSKIKSKVIIIQGMKDLLVPAGNTNYLLGKLNSDLILENIMLPDMGHFVIWQTPELVIENILKLDNTLEKVL